MKIITVPISKVKPWDKNPRNIKTKDMERLKKQIQELGVYKPMIACAENGGYTVLGGNMRLRALQDLRFKDVDVSLIEPKTEAEKIKYALSDNDRVGMYMEDELAELVYPYIDDIDLGDYKIDLGEPASLEDLISDYGPGGEGEDEVPEIDDSPAITKRGDLFLLGKHRLLCGDATDEGDVKRLMGGEKADMVFTDPPYGINVVGGNVDSNYYMPLKGDESIEVFKKHYELLAKLEIKKFIIWGGNYFTDILKPSRCWIVWDKKQTARFSRIEMAWTNFDDLPILYEWTWNGLQRQGNRTDELKSRIHPTQKPVGLFVNIIKDFEGSFVLDGFLGSGTTLIACEKLNRKCYGMEISEKYCDVIIKRYSDYADISEKSIRKTVQHA